MQSASFKLIIALIAPLLLQVNCKAVELPELPANSDQELETFLQETDPSELAAAQIDDYTKDSCHLLELTDLPASYAQINTAWEKTLPTLLTMTDAIEEGKTCFKWNAFVAVPCAIRATMKFFVSYRNNKPVFIELLAQIREAAKQPTINFVKCAKRLLQSRKRTSSSYLSFLGYGAK